MVPGILRHIAGLGRHGVCGYECACANACKYDCGSHRTTLGVHQEFCLHILSACESAGITLTLRVQLFTRVLETETHVPLLHSKCLPPDSAMSRSTYREHLVDLHTHMPVCCVDSILSCNRWVTLHIMWASLPAETWI